MIGLQMLVFVLRSICLMPVLLVEKLSNQNIVGRANNLNVAS